MRQNINKTNFPKMKLLASCIFFCCINVTVNCQVTEVVYKRKILGEENTFFEQMRYRLLFNDTMAFSHYCLHDKELNMEFKKIVKSSHVHHSTISFSKNDDTAYSISTIYSKVKKPWMHPYFSALKVVEYKDKQKDILGYSCKEALTVNNRNDSILIFYTEAIRKPYGPNGFNFAHGLVLEAVELKRRVHTFATSVRNIGDAIYLPENFKVVGEEEYESARRRRDARLNSFYR
jgi:GLPGLI family protein